MNTEQITKGYNPRDHLVKITGKDGRQKDYYPAAWRLYELNLRYPNANFSSDIVHMDIERDFVLVKCRLYLGPDYALSEKKTEAMKQGRLSTTDKVETAAKARCARDFGISTELALETDLDSEMEPVEEGRMAPTWHTSSAASNGHVDEVIRERLNSLYERAKVLKVCKTNNGFVDHMRQLLQLPALDIKTITSSQLDIIEQDIVARERQTVRAA
jgi:hypothetical protein